MNDRFRGSRLKIERAKKHLSDFNEAFVLFSNSNFNTLAIKEHPEERRTHSLSIEMDMPAFNALGDTATLIIGDVLHNLKGALDHLYYQVVIACDGTPSSHTRFPVNDTREILEPRINEILEKKDISREVATLILNGIKPYQTGNPAVWGLHKLNIVDKHERIIPTLKLVGFFNVRLEDEDGAKVGNREYVADESCLIPLTGTYRKKVKLKDKGRSSANIIFDIGAFAFKGEPVFPTLRGISEEVTRIVDAFEKIAF
jgi:hypothetical protein